MHFKTVFLSSCAAALALAQSSVLTFTRVPSPITAGHATALTYATNDTTSPVTIILRKGAATDLKTVATLTDHATGGQYLWTPSTSLTTGSDYALEITQGSQVNYYGPFSITGASGSTGSISSGPSPYPIPSHVSVHPIYSANGTTVLPGTGASGYGTASSFARNTTLSSATLPTTRKSTSVVTTTGAATSGGSATATGSGSHSTSSAPANAASGLEAGSSIALIFGAIAAVLYV